MHSYISCQLTLRAQRKKFIHLAHGEVQGKLKQPTKQNGHIIKRMGKYLALGQEAQTLLCLVCTSWLKAKCFSVRPSHSVNKYIQKHITQVICFWYIAIKVASFGFTTISPVSDLILNVETWVVPDCGLRPSVLLWTNIWYDFRYTQQTNREMKSSDVEKSRLFYLDFISWRTGVSRTLTSEWPSPPCWKWQSKKSQ